MVSSVLQDRPDRFLILYAEYSKTRKVDQSRLSPSLILKQHAPYVVNKARMAKSDPPDAQSKSPRYAIKVAFLGTEWQLDPSEARSWRRSGLHARICRHNICMFHVHLRCYILAKHAGCASCSTGYITHRPSANTDLILSKLL